MECYLEKRLEGKQKANKAKNPERIVANDKNWLSKFVSFVKNKTSRQFDETFFDENQERVVEEYLEYLRTSLLAPGTRTTYTNVVKKFINFCVEGQTRVFSVALRVDNAKKLLPLLQKYSFEFGKLVQQEEKKKKLDKKKEEEEEKNFGIEDKDMSKLLELKKKNNMEREISFIGDSDETQDDNFSQSMKVNSSQSSLSGLTSNKEVSVFKIFFKRNLSHK